VHYTDQGRGPVVVLLHASYLDLTSWDDWVRDLARDHRVLRIDRLRFGLTGTYPGNIVDYDHEVALLEAFVADRKLKHFALVGASSGGMVAALYAQRHPGQLDNLILMNFPLGHARIAAAPSVPTAPGGAARMRMILENNMVDQRAITPALVQRLGDFADREDEGGAVAASFDKAAALTEADRVRILGQIRTRTMVVWSAENRTLPLSAGQAAFAAIGAPQKYLTVVENAGHMVPLERGPDTALLARHFLAGHIPPATLAPW
jgi:pimeloyl-ACP methyl ester carboxylesterase